MTLDSLASALSEIDAVTVSRNREFVSARQEPFRSDLVIRPERPAAVGPILQVLNRFEQPTVILAGNTGLVGANVAAAGEVILDLSALDQIRAIVLPDGRRVDLSEQRGRTPEIQLAQWDADLAAALASPGHDASSLLGAQVVCEAGVPVDRVNALLRTYGIEYPMDMGSNSAATLGGCAANGSAGARAVHNGTGAHLTREARGFWGDGTPANSQNDQPGPPRILPGRPVIDSAALTLGESLIASQGLLGVITEVTVRTAALPMAREVVLASVDDLASGTSLVRRARDVFQSSGHSLELAELLDRDSLALVASKERLAIPFDRPETAERAYHVMLQVRADAREPAATLEERVLAFLEGLLEDAIDVFYDPTPGDDHIVRRVRHAVTHASDARLGEMRAEAARTGVASVGRLGFDVAVPLDRIDAFANAWRIQVQSEHPDLEMHLFGHLGVGGFHIHHRGRMDVARKSALMEAMARTVGAFQGTFSAEHGVGTLWAPMFLAHRPPEELAALARMLRARDPRGILNPRSHGKRHLLQRGA